MSQLFGENPGGMFDPWASPSLLMTTEDVLVPRTYNFLAGGKDCDDESTLLWRLSQGVPPPRRQILQFPSITSGLRIPHATLYYTPLAEAPLNDYVPKILQKKFKVNCYETQAIELANQMRSCIWASECRGLTFKYEYNSPEMLQLEREPALRVSHAPLIDAEYAELRIADRDGFEEIDGEAGPNTGTMG